MNSEFKDSLSDNQFIKGRNWGQIIVTDKELNFKGDDKPWFTIPVSSVANVVQTSTKNEFGLEFNIEKENQSDFLLCEMHFCVPDSKAEIKKEKEEDSEENEENEENEDNAKKSEKKELSYGESLKAQLAKMINGNITNYIAKVPEIQMIRPRGNFDLYFFENALKIHNASHNYKIQYQRMGDVFRLPKLDGHIHYLVVQLKQPINQGNTSYPYLIFQIKDEKKVKIDLNLSANLSDSDIQNPVEGPLKDVLAKLFVDIIKTRVIVEPKNFSFRNGPGIKCFNKSNDGALYPLEKGVLYLPKPVIYINHENIQKVELARTNEQNMSQRTFDLKVETKNEEFQFQGIEREELDNIIHYFNLKQIKFIHIDDSNNQVGNEPVITTKRQRPVVDEEPMELPNEEKLIGEDDYDDEDDEDEDMNEEDDEEDEEDGN